MDNIDRQLLQLLNNKMLFQNLREKLGITNEELINRLNKLKYRGYLLDRVYYEDRVYHHLVKQLPEVNPIITINHNSKDLRALFISDFHIGSTFDSPSKLHSIYNYCIQNKIHTIFVLGDIIEGTKYETNLRINDIETQVENIIQEYPYDNSIYNYVLLGNHDYHSITNGSFDISKMLFDSRYDFVSLGYIEAIVKIYNSPILLLHTNRDDSKIHEYLKKYPDIKFIAEGHFHQFHLETIRDSIIKLRVPTLSLDPRSPYAGAIDVTLANCFQDLIINPLVVEDSKVIPVGEICQKVLRK